MTPKRASFIQAARSDGCWACEIVGAAIRAKIPHEIPARNVIWRVMEAWYKPAAPVSHTSSARGPRSGSARAKGNAMDFTALLRFAVDHGASDIHVQAGLVPVLRLGGH